MATTTATADPALNKEYNNGAYSDNSTSHQDHAALSNGANVNTVNNANQPRGYGTYGGNPLAHAHTGESARLPAFGGEFQPGLYREPVGRKFANPAPLGLSAFALTTFVLSLINIGVKGVVVPEIIISLAFGYGGLVQLLAGMWEMAVGNTFGATALSSYGGFWISFAIILTPGGFEIGAAYKGTTSSELYAIGFYLMGWFIFTTLLLLCTLRSTVAFFLLFFFLDLAFLCLGIGYFYTSSGGPDAKLIAAGGYFGLFAAFLAWYNALAGIADSSNSFFVVPVAHFPWSVQGRANRAKTERETV